MRKVLWYTFLIPFSVLQFVFDLALVLAAALVGVAAVIQNLLWRYEHWTYTTPKDHFSNSPFNTTLKDVFVEAFKGAGR